MKSAFGIVLESDRSTENRHDTIADKLIDHSLVLIDGLSQIFQALVHERRHFFWIKRF